MLAPKPDVGNIGERRLGPRTPERFRLCHGSAVYIHHEPSQEQTFP
jgi:hypothetical protein